MAHNFIRMHSELLIFKNISGYSGLPTLFGSAGYEISQCMAQRQNTRPLGWTRIQINISITRNQYIYLTLEQGLCGPSVANVVRPAMKESQPSNSIITRAVT